MLLRTDHVLSVAYPHEVESRLVTTGSWDSMNTVTVDLDTGRAFTPKQTFSKATRTTRGLYRLIQLLDRHRRNGLGRV